MLETVTVAGLPPILTVSVSMSVEEAVRTATLNVVPAGLGVPVSVGQPVVLLAGSTTVLTGYVRDVNPSHDAETRALSVALVSRTVDATECSVLHPTGEVRDKSIADIAREFDGLGIGVEDDGGLPTEPVHRLRVGESQFHTIERRARGRGILIHDTAEGKLKLATRPAGTHAGGLVRGRNIKRAAATFSERGRHSKVHVRGQASEGVDAQQMRGQAVATDRGVSRERPLVLQHEGEATTERMKGRAEWRAKRAAGNAATAEVTVMGWRDDGGIIWTPNYLVHVQDDWVGINGMMLIKSVTLEQEGNDGDGTTATLSLADPRGYGGENPRGHSADAYTAPGNIKATWEQE
ncbi:phage baseplate assembly protein [Mycoplana ramosa]|uniref:Phage tail protein n=1 Tax=Mycoplana ramosa TaxID=40837 RepID=A0ABW3YWN9_MYCRA